MRILIGLIEHMGDIVACEPVARYLKLNHPEAHISWAVGPAYRELIDTNPFVDQTIPLDCLTEWIRLQSHGEYDKIIDLHANYRGCPHCKIPLIKQHGNPFVTVHEWFDHGALLEAFALGAGLPRLSAQPQMYLGEEHAEAVDRLQLPADICVLHRISSTPEKDWTNAGWQSVVAFVQDRLGLQVVEIGAGAADLPEPLPGTISLVNRLPLLQTAEVINRARLFIGIDSGPAHFANALKTPGVVLLGRYYYFRHYSPFTGFYAGPSPLVKILHHLTGPARELTTAEVIEAVSYVAAATEITGWSRQRLPRIELPHWAPPAAAESELILTSGLFDTGWFAINQTMALETSLHPVDQYLSQPAMFTASTSPAFDGAKYLREREDVLSAGVNPLLHYLRTGGTAQSLARRARSDQDARLVATSELHVATTPPLDLPAVLQPLPETANGDDGLPRLFAFYLPQYHPIQENDQAHGPGFSEWHNVVKGKPQFRGHYQPKIPGELGYYDLRATEVLHKQVRLAKEYGISGFCFYYYYFKGRKLLFDPIEAFIKSDTDMPFMLLWANENWTRRWDGGTDELIIAQAHSSEDDLIFLRGLLPLFADPRYVKVDGKPVLMIYKVHLFPKILATVELWRTEISKLGFPGLYLVMVDDWTADLNHPRDFGFDASYEIPSNLTLPEMSSSDVADLDVADGFTGQIVDYAKFARYHLARPAPNYRRFRTVMLPWDNTARYGARASVHINGLGDWYRMWLLEALLDTFAAKAPSERFVFIHSWNEWCEGTYLEPDGRHGRFFLEQTRMAIDVARQAIGRGMTVPPERTLAELLKLQQAKDEGAAQGIRAARRETHHIARDMSDLRQQLDAALNLIDSIHASTSWRLTRPLRTISWRLIRPLRAIVVRLKGK